METLELPTRTSPQRRESASMASTTTVAPASAKNPSGDSLSLADTVADLCDALGGGPLHLDERELGQRLLDTLDAGAATPFDAELPNSLRVLSLNVWSAPVDLEVRRGASPNPSTRRRRRAERLGERAAPCTAHSCSNG